MVQKIFEFDHRIVRVESNIRVGIVDTAGKISCEPTGCDLLVCLPDLHEPELKPYIYIDNEWQDTEKFLNKLYPHGEFACSHNGVSYNKIYFCPLDGRILTIKQLHGEIMKFFGGR